MNTLIKISIERPLSRSALVLITLVLVCFALPQKMQAVSPAPDGGYPGGNTAEGQNALFSLTTGGYNTAVGFLALKSNIDGSSNTAFGAGASLPTPEVSHYWVVEVTTPPLALGRF